ncbi:MAG: hypothetical protein LWX56_09175 [Ignavibacteria bacterium]|nr:hypothetical protein [Ignavibacteria bacterium]
MNKSRVFLKILIISVFFLLSKAYGFANSSTDGNIILSDSTGHILSVYQKQDSEQLTRCEDSLISVLTTRADSVIRSGGLPGDHDSLGIVTGRVTDMQSFTRQFLAELDTKISDFYTDCKRQLVQAKQQDEASDAELAEQAASMRDSLTSIIADSREQLADSLDSMLDQLSDYVDYLVQSEVLKPAHVTISVLSNTHNSANMRDDGIVQTVITPVVYAHLPFNFSIGLSESYFADAGQKWDGATFLLNYRYRFASGIGVEATYSHFSFSSTAVERKAQFNNAAGGVLSYLRGNYYLEFTYDTYLGSINEPVLGLNGQYSIELAPQTVDYDLSLIPGFQIAWSQQDNSITTSVIRNNPKNGKTTTVTTTKTKTGKMGIFGYLLSGGLEYNYKRLTLDLVPQWILPANVDDASTRHGYFNFMAGLTWEFRLFK